MRKLLITMFALLTATVAFAQDDSQEQQEQSRWGIKGGLNLASQVIFNEGQTQLRLGAHLGVMFPEIEISAKVGFQPEAVYSMQGGVDREGTDKIDYVNLPLIFKIYVVQRRLSIDIGPQLGWMISAKRSSEWTTTDLYSHYSLNKLDVSIAVGLSYKANENIDLIWRNNIGVNYITTQTDHRNAVVQFGLGIWF
jgi:hypothetical protein